jgi:PAS domain S-box-containing protein
VSSPRAKLGTGAFEAINARFIDTLPVAACVCDRDGRLVHVNPRAVTVWGREASPADRFSGAYRLRHRDGSPMPHDQSPMAEVLRTGETLQDVEYIVEQPGGTQLTVRATVVPLTAAGGERIGAINTFQDITLQKRAFTDRAQLAAIVDSSDDAVVGKTLDGVITSWNTGASRIFGYSAEEAIGQHISFIIPPDRLAEEDHVLAELRRGRRIDHFETVRRAKDGRLLNISLTVSPIRDDSGRIIGASKVARDITDQTRAGQAIATSQQRYRRIFEATGVSIWDDDFSLVKRELDWLRAAGVEDFAAYFDARPEVVERLVRLVQVVDVNQATLEMFEAPSREALLGALPAIRDANTRAVFTRQLVAIAKGETRFQAELALRTLAGARLDVQLNVTFPAPHESFESVLISLTDITRRKQFEEELKQQVQVRETLARVGASLAAELDSDRLVQAVTDTATALTSAEFGALFYNVTNDAGESSQRFTVSGASREALEGFPALTTTLGGPAFRSDGVVRIDDVREDERFGDLRVRSYLAVPVISRAGEVLGGLFFGHSRPGVFEARHEQLAAGIASWAGLALDNAGLYRTAQVANRTKDEFLATLSHELRTPLNAVLGWSHMLSTGTLPSDLQRRAFEAIERNARAQAQLVDDLLDVSRIVSGRLSLTMSDVDLTAVVHSAIDTVRPAAAAKGVELEIADQPPGRPIVAGDADRLRQVYWNLLSNAVKFTPRGGRIRVKVCVRDQAVEVVVADTGQGIPPEFLGHVFERFRQADSTASRRHGGLGLGLAIVRHLTEAHGGTVQAASPGDGRGATFTVRLPLRAMAARAEARAAPTPTSTSLGGLSLLVVDDEPDAREFLRLLLEAHGARVATAGSAGEALEILLHQSVDALLADLGMPDQDGFSLIAAVRELRPGGTLPPAIAVTAYAGIRERDRAMAAGYGWHVTKPVDADQLVSVVASATNRADR